MQKTIKTNPIFQLPHGTLSQHTIYNLGFICSIALPVRAAISSTVSVPSEIMPTPLAIALAVIGWSPVTMMTLMPALLHLATASGTAARGGSIMDMRPTNLQHQGENNWQFSVLFLYYPSVIFLYCAY